MLIIKRHPGESVTINENITITVVQSGSQVKLAIDAPRDTPILRAELIQREKKDVRSV